MSAILSALVAFFTALPSIIKLVERFIALYEEGVKSNSDKLLRKADADVDGAITDIVKRVQNSNSLRESVANEGTGFYKRSDSSTRVDGKSAEKT